jgi:hypothetical protein
MKVTTTPEPARGTGRRELRNTSTAALPKSIGNCKNLQFLCVADPIVDVH